MEAGMVLDMFEAMDGREAVAILNAGDAHALYGCLIQGGKDRVAKMAAELGVRPKTVYAWCANRATPPTAALRYCVETFQDVDCMRALEPKSHSLVSHAKRAGVPERVGGKGGAA